MDYKGKRRGYELSPTEFKGGTVENWLPMKGIIRIPQGFVGGLGKLNCDIIKLLPPLPLPCPEI